MAVNTHSISLNGSSQYLTAADSASLSVTGAITIECWVKFDTLPASNTSMSFFSKSDWDAQRSYELFYWNDGGTLKLRWYTNDSGGTPRYTTVTKTFSTGVWYHLCVTNDTSGNVKFYVDGTQEGSTQTGGSSIKDTTAQCIIGGEYYSGASHSLFDGLIDEVRIWNVARTATEINANKSISIDSATNLVASWHLNNALTDSSGNGNTLTNNGSATFSTDIPYTDITGPSILIEGFTTSQIASIDGISPSSITSIE